MSSPSRQPDLSLAFGAVLARDERTPFGKHFDFEADGVAHPVLFEGNGPAIILMHEMPGFVPEFWRLAHWLVEAGFTVYAPALYDHSGAPIEELTPRYSLAGSFARACVSREIHLFSKHGGSPISDWLRALARHVHKAQGGPGVGVVGLCLTGNFAWSVAVDPAVRAAVASEPAMPFNNDASLHLEAEEVAGLRQRTAEELQVLALRFDGDPTCKAARFDALEDLLGDKLETRVLPDEAKHPQGNPFPHAVLTKDLIAEDGQPTYEAAREVLGFFTDRLKA